MSIRMSMTFVRTPQYDLGSTIYKIHNMLNIMLVYTYGDLEKRGERILKKVTYDGD